MLSNQTTIHSSSVGWRILQGAPLSGRNARVLLPRKEYIGCGMTYQLDKHDGTLRITAVYPDSPAAKAGFEKGWIVQKMNGVPTAGKSYDECMALGRGAAGTTVRFELVHPERTRTNTGELIQGKFLLE